MDLLPDSLVINRAGKLEKSSGAAVVVVVVAVVDSDKQSKAGILRPKHTA
jgi:hypothetical protein